MWGTVVCIPVTLTAIFIWTLVESLQNIYINEGEKEEFTVKDTGYGNLAYMNTNFFNDNVVYRLTIMSFIPFVLNLVYIKVVFSNKHRISKTISVIEVKQLRIRRTPGHFLYFISSSLHVTFACIIQVSFSCRFYYWSHLSYFLSYGSSFLIDYG